MIWQDLRGFYGVDYNEGRLGHLGAFSVPGHWEHPLRWKASAAGILSAFEDIEGHAPETILELGCGRGSLVWALEERGLSVVGLDLAEDIRYSERCVVGNAIALPFAKRFECVIALDIIEHVPSDYQAALLSELRRVCSGIVLATVPTDGPPRIEDSAVGVRNHYLVLSSQAWAAHFAAHGFDVVADAERLSAFGVPFAWGAANYPFALRPGAGEN